MANGKIKAWPCVPSPHSPHNPCHVPSSVSPVPLSPAPVSPAPPHVGSPPQHLLLIAAPPSGAQRHEEGAKVMLRSIINCIFIFQEFQEWFTESRRDMEEKGRELECLQMTKIFPTGTLKGKMTSRGLSQG